MALEKFRTVWTHESGRELKLQLHNKTQNHNQRTIKTNNRPFLIQIKLNKYQKTEKRAENERKNHTEYRKKGTRENLLFLKFTDNVKIYLSL